jgi:hypothetical protein
MNGAATAAAPAYFNKSRRRMRTSLSVAFVGDVE